MNPALKRGNDLEGASYSPTPQVVNRYGEPYAVRDLGKDNYAYEYIERVSMNNELMYGNHYFLTIEDGKVVSKCFRE